MEKFIRAIASTPFHKVLYVAAGGAALWSAWGYWIFFGEVFRDALSDVLPVPALLGLFSVVGGLFGLVLLAGVQWFELRPICTMHGHGLHSLDDYIARSAADCAPKFDWRKINPAEVLIQNWMATFAYGVDLVVSLFVWPIVSYQYLAAGAITSADFSLGHLISAALCVRGLQLLVKWALKAELEWKSDERSREKIGSQNQGRRAAKTA